MSLRSLTLSLTRTANALGAVPWALGLLPGRARGTLVFWILAQLALALAPVGMLLFTRELIDRLAERNASSSLELELHTLWPAAGLITLALGREFLGWIEKKSALVLRETVEDEVLERIHRQSGRIDLAFFETSRFHDELFRAQQLAEGRVPALLETLAQGLRELIGLGSVLIVISAFGWVPLLSLSLILIPGALLVLHEGAKRQERRSRQAPLEREARETSQRITNPAHAAELRLLELTPFWSRRFRRLRAQLLSVRFELEHQSRLVELGTLVCFWGLAGLIVAWWSICSLEEQASVGSMVALGQSFLLMERSGRSAMRQLSNAQENLLFVEQIRRFLELEPRSLRSGAVELPEGPLTEPLVLDAVHFTYPGRTRPVIQDLSLTFLPQKTTAVMGVNGVGKTTLCRLLLRLYDPDQGELRLGARPLGTLDLVDFRRRSAMVLQEPGRYFLSLRENLLLGLSREPSAEELEETLAAVGLLEFVRRLEHGLETRLGTHHRGGRDLSVGEWQRLALARALLRKPSLLVMDEPTSAIDPWTEMAWLDQIRQRLPEATVIVVTHRINCAMKADQVVLLDPKAPPIVGTHAELSETSAPYRQLLSAASPVAPRARPSTTAQPALGRI